MTTEHQKPAFSRVADYSYRFNNLLNAHISFEQVLAIMGAYTSRGHGGSHPYHKQHGKKANKVGKAYPFSSKRQEARYARNGAVVQLPASARRAV